MLILGILMGIILMVLAWFEFKKSHDGLLVSEALRKGSLYRSASFQRLSHAKNRDAARFSLSDVSRFQKTRLSEK